MRGARRLLPARAAVVVAVAGIGWSPQTGPTFPSAVELITVDAVVLDGEGAPVRGLTRDDFVVSEDGEPQPIVSFEAFDTGNARPAAPPAPNVVASNEVQPASPGRAFAVVLDDVGMNVGEATDVRRAVSTFLQRPLGVGDEVTVATVSGDAWWSARLPEGRADLLAVAERLRGRNSEDVTAADSLSDYEAFWIHNRGSVGQDEVMRRVVDRFVRANLCEARGPGRGNCADLVRGRAAALDERRRQRAALVLRALRRALDGLSTTRARKSLLFFSPGFLADHQGELRDVLSASRLANTAVYFLDARGLRATPGAFAASATGPAPDPQDAGAIAFEGGFLESTGAQALAVNTGGAVVRNTDLSAAADRVAAESRVFYLLGFHPRAGRSATAWRKLDVQVKGGLVVRARRGYTLSPAADPVKAAARALDSGRTIAGVPLRVMAYVFEPRPKGTARVVIAAEFDPRAAGAAQRAETRVEVGMVLTHRDSGRSLASDVAAEVRLKAGETAGWRTLVREFDVPPGVAQARVVVRDPVSGVMGAVAHRFEVPRLDTLRTSTPILTTRVEPGSGPGEKPRPAVAVHRVFRPQGPLYCGFQVFGAARGPGQGAPQVAVGVEVRAAGGQVVLRSPATPVTADPDGRVGRLMAFGLDRLAEGDYEVILDVTDEVTGRRIERREPFALAMSAE
jgi:VWFA-related protein